MSRQTRRSWADKSRWVREGEAKEREFVDVVCPFLGLEAILNPEKKKNVKAPGDLMINGGKGELKYRQTPLFTAPSKCGIPAQYCCSINVSKFDTYCEKTPELTIYIWIEWTELSMEIYGREYSVWPMCGIWHGNLDEIKAATGNRGLVHHPQRPYQHEDDASFGVDVRRLACDFYRGYKFDLFPALLSHSIPKLLEYRNASKGTKRATV